MVTGDAYPLLIGGEFVAGGAGTYAVHNPATEDVVGYASEASPADVEAAVKAATDAFPAWSQTPAEERARLLDAAADLIERRAKELVPLVQAETGATLAVTKTMQVPVCAQRFRRYARGALEPVEVPLAPMAMKPTALAPGGLVGATAVRAPVGVVACITPYNFPLVNMAGKIGPALARGNTVVVKPAPQDPLAVVELARILDEVGFPPGVVNVVTGSKAETGAALCSMDDVDMVSFTGSTAVGVSIAEAAARTMKRLLLELGGKGASLVFADADLEKAAMGTASVWMFHSGQICTAPTRLVVERAVYDEMVERLAKLAPHLKVGDPLERDTVVGPLISAPHRERVEGYVALGRDEGAEVMVGGGRPAHMDRGYFTEPTLLAGARNDMRVAREEIFGPVIVAIPFDEEDEGIAIVNDSPFGLYDYVWSGDTARAMHVARRLRTGNVGINTRQRNFETPFGGFKMSGVGRDGGSFALHAYSELQSIVWPG